MKKLIFSMLLLVFGLSTKTFATTLADLPTGYRTSVENATDLNIKYVNTSSLNVRTQPNTDSDIIRQFSYGDVVEVIASVGDWDCIVIGDDYYFVHNNYLRFQPVDVDRTDENLNLLAHIINAEMGIESWEDKLYTGSVVLNRVSGDPWWGNTIREVIFKKGQYSPTWNGTFWNEPNEDSWRAASYLLENGSIIPDNVVFQAEFKQGSGIWKKTHGAYYCYR